MKKEEISIQSLELTKKSKLFIYKGYIIILSLEYHKDLCRMNDSRFPSIFLCVYDEAMVRIAVVIARQRFFYHTEIRSVIIGSHANFVRLQKKKEKL